MWTQVVGKVALALAPPLNHSWAIAMQVTARGLATRTLAYGALSFTMEFDFVDHQLVVRASDGRVRKLALEPQSVADFYRKVMALLARAVAAGQDLADAGRDPVADPVRPGHGSPFVRSGVRDAVLADPRARREGLHRFAVRLCRQVQPGAFFLGQLRSRRHALFGQTGAARARGPHSCARRTRTK